MPVLSNIIARDGREWDASARSCASVDVEASHWAMGLMPGDAINAARFTPASMCMDQFLAMRIANVPLVVDVSVIDPRATNATHRLCVFVASSHL